MLLIAIVVIILTVYISYGTLYNEAQGTRNNHITRITYDSLFVRAGTGVNDNVERAGERNILLDAITDPCWSSLIARESGFNHLAKNPNSTASGLGQFLDSTWEDTGYAKSNDPEIQLKAMRVYAEKRYGSMCKALEHNLTEGWY